MEKEKINAIFKHKSKRDYKFKSDSVKDLTDIMSFFETTVKTKKGNWSLKLLKEFNNKCFISDTNILLFYDEYSKRKKQNKGFEKFIKKISRSMHKPLYSPKEKTLKIRDKSKLKLFLEDFKLLKAKYLIGTNKDLLYLINKNIDTGLKEATLRNYYYKLSD